MPIGIYCHCDTEPTHEDKLPTSLAKAVRNSDRIVKDSRPKARDPGEIVIGSYGYLSWILVTRLRKPCALHAILGNLARGRRQFIFMRRPCIVMQIMRRQVKRYKIFLNCIHFLAILANSSGVKDCWPSQSALLGSG